VLLAAVLIATCSAGIGDPAEADGAGCPTATKTLRLTGTQSTRYRNTRVGVGTTIDARDAIWGAVGAYPIHLDGGSRDCWIGGIVMGDYGPTTSWDALHDTGALNVFLGSTELLDVRVHNYGDGIRLLDRASDFRIRRAHLSYVRDDCIENDRLHAGLVEDALLDGCYVAFSARRHSNDSTSGTQDSVWTIRDSLVRLQPMPTVYRGPAPGHGGFFKWGSLGLEPRLVLHGNVFRADQNSNHTTMGIPPGALASCSDNVMVWLGPGAYPAPLPACFTVTTDAGVWHRAVAEWHATHGVG
jgi:hypothetical protein